MANLMIACCNCDTNPIGEFFLNKIKLSEISPNETLQNGIAMKLEFQDSIPSLTSRFSNISLYSSAFAFTKCTCPQNQVINSKIENIKIYTLNELDGKYPKNTEVSKLFVASNFTGYYNGKILKSTLGESIKEINKRKFFYINSNPILELFFTYSNFQKPAKFRIEVTLKNGEKISSESPIFN